MPQTVLICDDDARMRQLVSAVLGRHDYTLVEAANGQATLDALDRHHPDLVILDVHMPGIDGLATLRQIRSEPRLASTRVLLLSGSVEMLDEHPDADAQLSKPFAVGELDATVQALLAPDAAALGLSS